MSTVKVNTSDINWIERRERETMNFYEICSHRGRFWIQAARASDAYRIAARILGDNEFSLERCNELAFRLAT